MSKVRLFLSASLLSALALSLGACSTVSGSGSAPGAQAVGLRPAQAVGAKPPADDDASLYGLFLAGQAAMDDGKTELAADFFERASKREPGAIFLKERAFTAALVAGDVHRAATLAPGADEGSLSSQSLGRLARAADALADGRGRESEAALAGLTLSQPHRTAGLLLAPWTAAAAGDWKVALTLPEAKGDRLVEQLSRLTQAQLLERAKRYDEADAAFRALMVDGDGLGVATSAYAEFLLRRGRKADALAQCDASLKGDPNNRTIRLIRDHALANAPPPPMPTLAQGAAQSMLAPAAIFLAEKQPELGLAYLRLSLRLDPARDEAWMLVGDTMASLGDAGTARDSYRHVATGSPDFVAARARLIQTYDQPADAPTVLALAQDTVKAAPDDDDALALLADALRASERYDESAKVMDTLMAHLGDKASWQAYYMRGIALDRSGHWPEAERDFRKALAIKPDESEVLNYLGFSWIDRGVKLEEAKAMVEKAVSAKPDSGAMVDSLGWAYYRLGDFSQAVEQLERAAELEPADPEINNHLGDAYWKVGRRIEARFQWEQVLGLSPEAKLKAEVENKLKNGLGADGRPALPSPVVATR
ncbi:MAG: tetratricopeptide repeat protein [Caulobacteraceae bacterium]|nr:tetratricopeptide repeat protein [Caulobacteraceae bacterium]